MKDNHRLARVSHLAPLLVVAALLCLGLWRHRPPPVIRPAPCRHPAAMIVDGKAPSGPLLRVCLTGPSEPLASVLRRGAPGLCPAGPGPGDRARLAVGQLLRVRSPHCRLSVESLPAAAILALGLKLDINRATTADLQTLPRVGPVLARRIVAHRHDHGPFSTVDSLVRVKGIGPVTLKRLRSLVRCNKDEE